MPDFVTEACNVIRQLAFLIPFQPVTAIPEALRHHSVTSPQASVSVWRVLRVLAVTSAPEGTQGSSLTAHPATSALLSGM